MTAEQLRAARAILRLEQMAVAKRAGVSVETIKRLERQNGSLQANFDTIRRLKEALELAGIEFVDGGKNHGPGVRLVVDRVAVLAEQINHHVVAAINAADELEELTRHDPQSVPKYIAYAFDVLISQFRVTRRRGRSKGGA